MRRERSASSSDGIRSAPVPPNLGETGSGAYVWVRVRADEEFVRPPNPQSWGRQEQGQMTGTGDAIRRERLRHRATEFVRPPNPQSMGGDGSRGR